VIKLILFDIDGTLVLTGGAGLRAMTRAFSEVFGVGNGFEGIAMNGRTDRWIIGQMAALHGIDCDEATFRQFRDTYVSHLTTEVHQPGPRKGVMPGVRPLLDMLQARSDAFLALLTGNFEAGARVKLEYFDLWKYFRCGAFGDHAQERNGLLGTALDRVRACGGPHVSPADVVIVGDTPLDVAVAAAGGARSVAVATGTHDIEALRASGADVALQDLSDAPCVLSALGLG
jgi:phosphoglycolate phosphatase-like HAD superfamily hydrolase